MNKSNFFDNYFRFLVLLFWPLVWYRWVIISDFTIDLILVSIFCILAIIYIVLYILNWNKTPKVDNIVHLYRISLLFAFVSTLFSFILFPTNLFLLFLKIIFIIICFYYSCIKVFKYKIDEGLVGILSCILLLAITFLY